MSRYGQLEDEPEPQQQPTSNYNSTKSGIHLHFDWIFNNFQDVYSKYRIPPDVAICEKHYVHFFIFFHINFPNKLAFSIGEDDPTKNEVCPCCGMRVVPIKI